MYGLILKGNLWLPIDASLTLLPLKRFAANRPACGMVHLIFLIWSQPLLELAFFLMRYETAAQRGIDRVFSGITNDDASLPGSHSVTEERRRG